MATLIAFIAASSLFADQTMISGGSVTTGPTTSVDVEFWANVPAFPASVYDYNLTLELSGPGAGSDVLIDSCGETSSTGSHPPVAPFPDIPGTGPFVYNGGLRCLVGTLNLGDPIPPAYNVADQAGLVRVTLDIANGTTGGPWTISVVQPDFLPNDETQIINDLNQLVPQPYSTTAATVSIVPSSLEGDYDASGQVEQADLSLVLANWGQPSSPLPQGWVNDLPEGIIDQEELSSVLSNWGNSTTDSSPSRIVPEPHHLHLLLVFACTSLAFGRRSRHDLDGANGERNG